MNTTKTSSILRSFIIIPMIATSLSLSSFTAGVDQYIATKSDDQVTLTQAQILQAEREEKAAKIDAYFGVRDLPLEGYGMNMVLSGEKYGVDPYLIAGLAMRESTACKFIIRSTYNCFGWGGGKIKFKSYEHAIDVVAMNLGGYNEKTAHYYKDKSVKDILETYNPPSVVATYASEVMGIMKKIDAMPV